MYRTGSLIRPPQKHAPPFLETRLLHTVFSMYLPLLVGASLNVPHISELSSACLFVRSYVQGGGAARTDRPSHGPTTFPSIFIRIIAAPKGCSIVMSYLRGIESACNKILYWVSTTARCYENASYLVEKHSNFSCYVRYRGQQSSRSYTHIPPAGGISSAKHG